MCFAPIDARSQGASSTPAPRFFGIPSVVTLIAVLFACLPAASAQVGLKVQLVPESTAIQPGRPFYVGLFIQHEPGYHTYWRFPGIVGVATTMEWDLPPGFSAGPLEYPEPEETMMFQIKAQGYERDVLLQTRITPPKNLIPGQTVTLTGKAAWMCCGRTCHPDSRTLTLQLPVAEQAAPHPEWQPLFEKERAAFAHPSESWTAEAEEDETTVTLTIKPVGADARIFASSEDLKEIHFFTEDGWINSDEPQQARLTEDGRLTMVLRRADVYTGKNRPDRLRGIVRRPGGWLEGGQLRSMIVAPVLSPGRQARSRSGS
jgi:thiol:disulfide interchange protein DsbD